MYAIINISGKQYKVVSGARTRVPKQDGETGTRLTFDKVLLINDGKNTEIGDPILKGASVTGTIVDHGRDKKILVYKKKRRKGYQRKNGHQQRFTEIEFNAIRAGKIQSTQGKTISTEAILEEEE
ncbi:MAG: 50S ribosomal protein L21 [Candidatus Neomarinimicrobiota bacterium]